MSDEDDGDFLGFQDSSDGLVDLGGTGGKKTSGQLEGGKKEKRREEGKGREANMLFRSGIESGGLK